MALDSDTASVLALRIHIRVLCVVLVLVSVGTLGGFWIGYNELKSLRKDLTVEIAKRATVRFSLQDALTTSSDRNSENGIKEPHVLFTYQELSSSNINKHNLHEIEPDDEPLEPVDTEVEDQLLRVKRDAQELNSFYEQGSGIPDDYVWMTSYAKVPVGGNFHP